MDSVFVNSHPDHGLMGCYLLEQRSARMKGRHRRNLGQKTLIFEGLNSSLAGSIIVGVREMDDLIERPAALQTIMEGTR
jgi:hypothetical protein